MINRYFTAALLAITSLNAIATRCLDLTHKPYNNIYKGYLLSDEIKNILDNPKDDDINALLFNKRILKSSFNQNEILKFKKFFINKENSSSLLGNNYIEKVEAQVSINTVRTYSFLLNAYIALKSHCWVRKENHKGLINFLAYKDLSFLEASINIRAPNYPCKML